jgi:tetratricopeptide (TPR) repeat protein
MNSVNEAEQAFRRALAIEPNRASAHYGLALTLIDRSRFMEASAALREAVKADPNNVEALHELGKTLLRLGDRAGAIQCFDAALTLKPDYEPARIDLAKVRR